MGLRGQGLQWDVARLRRKGRETQAATRMSPEDQMPGGKGRPGTNPARGPGALASQKREVDSGGRGWGEDRASVWEEGKFWR